MTGRIPILDVAPVVECGRYPAKAVVGETIDVTATVFREGHDAVAATAVLRDPTGADRQRIRMHGLGEDRWSASLTPDSDGDWSFVIEGWADPINTWRHTAHIKVEAAQDIELVFTDGAHLTERVAAALPKGLTNERQLLRDTAKAMRDERRPPEVRLAAALAPDVAELLDAHPLRDLVTEAGPFPLRVERERALYGSWYEFFPRSEGAHRNDDGSWT